jgi:hypothetical protein
MFRKAAPGDTLDHATAETDMICRDLDGDLVVIDRLVDHKHAEVGIWSNGGFGFYGDRVRYDELTWTGETYQIGVTPEAAKVAT